MDTERYSRQLLLKQFSKKDQEKLLESKIAIIGIGGTGTVVAELLARVGLGTITLADRDCIEKSNLQRQILFDEDDIGKTKADAAKEKLEKINSKTKIISIVCDIDASNIQKIVQKKDLIIDCTDNMETRFLINDCSKKHRTPWIYTAAAGSKGATMNLMPKDRPCFRCIFKDIPKTITETHETSGILNSATTAIASLAVTESIKILTGKKHSKTLTYIDVWNQKIDRIFVKKRKDCPSCNGKYEFLEKKRNTIKSCGENAYHITPTRPKKLDLNLIFSKLHDQGTCSIFGPVLHFKKDDIEFSIFRDGRAIIKNVKTKERAEQLYSTHIGR
ncbi:MAG: ThiF family adenylyltransferase [archaeon]|nr:ThiF family adenylyltransferase [archaeon]